MNRKRLLHWRFGGNAHFKTGKLEDAGYWRENERGYPGVARGKCVQKGRCEEREKSTEKEAKI